MLIEKTCGFIIIENVIKINIMFIIEEKREINGTIISWDFKP